MKKIVLIIIGLLALFSMLRVHSAENELRFTVHPSVIEFADKDHELSIGFGLVDSAGDKTKTWEVFPIKIALQSGRNRLYLSLNGLTLLTQSGVFFGDKSINGTYRGDVVSFGGRVTVNGRVEGNVWVFSADAVLNAGSVVVGDVVTVGGNIRQAGGSYIRGNKNALPEFSIPFIGLLATAQSAATIHFLIELFGIILVLLILFLVLFFRKDAIGNQVESLFTQWKATLLYLVFSLIVIPVLIFFLVASVIGVMVVPIIFLFIIAAAYYGFLVVLVRVGKFFFKNSSDSIPHLFLCGLIGLFVLKAPSLFGILASLLVNDVAIGIGAFLKIIGAVLIFAAYVYGFGRSLLSVKQRM
ncbi:MAG: hypothetical protein JW881_12435 [Spirochaetales bacterium]|nr:hypothetical protein [Spirochaetales bacterium]